MTSVFNPNPTNISKSDIALLYVEILLRWEKGLKDVGFNIRAKGFNKFLKDNALEIVSRDSLPEMTVAFEEHSPTLKAKEQNILIFYNVNGSQAKSLYFHVRNAIAHGHIERVKIGRAYYYYFEGNRDNTLQRERMKGQIKASILHNFVTALQLTAKNQK